MNTPILIAEKEFERVYRLNNNEVVRLVLEESEHEDITFYNSKNEKIGIFEFRPLEEYATDYKLTYMHLDLKGDTYKRKGLGRTALIFFKELVDANIYASPNDGLPRDDGSHLTGDALYFVSKMKDEGLISGDYPSLGGEDFEPVFLDVK